MLSTQRDIVYFLKSHCKQMLYHRVRMRQIIHVYFNNNHDKTHFNNNQSNTFVLFFVLFFSLFSSFQTASNNVHKAFIFTYNCG